MVLELLRRRQHHGTVPNRYPTRGPGPPPPQQVSQYRHYNPRPQYNRSPPRIRHHGYDTKPDTFDDTEDNTSGDVLLRRALQPFTELDGQVRTHAVLICR